MVIQAPLVVLDEHKDTIRSLVFNPSGNTLASLSITNDNRIVLWDTTTWEPISKFYSGPGTTTLYFSPDGTELIGTGVNKELRIWDIQSTRETIVPLSYANAQVRFVSPGVTHVIFCNEGSLLYYHLQERKFIGEVPLPQSSSAIYHHCGWLSENARYVAIQDRDYSIRVLDVEHSNNIVQLFGHRSSIVDIDYYLEGGMLISAGSDGAVNIWNLLSGEIIKNFNCSDSDIREVKYNSRLSMAIIVNGENDIALWDVISEKRIAKLGGHDSQISIALRYDGKLLASGSDDFRIRIWELDHS